MGGPVLFTGTPLCLGHQALKSTFLQNLIGNIKYVSTESNVMHRCVIMRWLASATWSNTTHEIIAEGLLAVARLEKGV